MRFNYLLRDSLCVIGLVAAFVGRTFAQGLVEIELGDVAVRAAKDAAPFLRNLEDIDEGPQSLVLQNENLFIHCDGVATINGTAVPLGTQVLWSVFVSGKQFVQAPTEVLADGSFSLNSANGFESDVNWVHTVDTGDVTVFVGVSIMGEDVIGTSELYAITTFESVLPLLMLIVLAILSRNVYVAMFFGIWIGTLVITGGDIVLSFKILFDDHIVPSAIEEYNFRTVLFTLFLGGLLALIKYSGGQEGFSNWVASFATTARRTQLAAVAAGVGLFFDDYSSALILGASFKKLTDKFYVSREKLAFVVDSTAAPISSIAPISSWIAFELGRIKPELEFIKGASNFPSKDNLPGEYVFFLNTIPSRYYPLFMLVIQLTLIIAAVEFGPMLFAERKARVDLRTDGGDGATDIAVEADLTNPEPDTPKRAWNFFIPLTFFIVSLLWSMANIGIDNIDADNGLVTDGNFTERNARNVFGASDSFLALVYTTMGASLFSLVFYLIQTKRDGEMVLPTKDAVIAMIDCRFENTVDQEYLAAKEADDAAAGGKTKPLMGFTEGVNVWIEGFKNLVPAIIVLSLAFTIKSIVKGCGTDRFITDIIINGDVDAKFLPTIIFFVSALLSFCTGTSFGTMSIMFPLVSFATWQKSEGQEDLYTIAMSSILSGAIFGDHSSLISDTTILSSIGAGCSVGSHVYTQLPYAIWGAIFAMLVGTLPAGGGAPPVLMLFLGGFILCVATLLVSAPIVSKTGKYDVFTNVYRKIFRAREHEYEAFTEKTAKFAAEYPDLVNSEPFAFCMGLKSRFMSNPDEVVEAKPAETNASL